MIHDPDGEQAALVHQIAALALHSEPADTNPAAGQAAMVNRAHAASRTADVHARNTNLAGTATRYERGPYEADPMRLLGYDPSLQGSAPPEAEGAPYLPDAPLAALTGEPGERQTGPEQVF